MSANPRARLTKSTRFTISLKTREMLAAYAFLAPFMAFFLVFVVRAVVEAVRMSFYDWHILRPSRPYIGIENYLELVNDDVWWIALQNTIVFTALTVIGTTIVALAAAVAVTRPIRGQNFFRVLLYTPGLLSVGAVGLVWVWLLNTQFGIVNYGLSFVGMRPVNWLGDPGLVIPSLSLTSIWWGFGFPMLIFIAGLQGIPEQFADRSLTRNGPFKAEALCSEAGESHVREPVGEPNLHSLALCRAYLGRLSDVLGGGSAVVLNCWSGYIPKLVYQSKTCGVWRSSHS